MKRVVLFTGQIRDTERGALLLRTIEAYRDSHQPTILLSTWQDEVSRWPDFQAVLKAADVRIVVQEEPGPRARGHLLHQVLAIDAGLAQCDLNAYVLKTRTDLGSVADVHAFFRSDPPDPATGRSPFNARVATRGFFAAQPFFLNDISFAGIANDLRRLSSMPTVADATYSRANSTEQMIWAPSFAARHPELDPFFRLNPGLVFNDAALQARVRERLIVSTLYRRALAIFYTAVADSLRWLLPMADDAAVAQACRARTLEDLLWSSMPIPGMFHHTGAASNFITHRAAARVLSEGAYTASPFGDAVADLMRLYRAAPPPLPAAVAQTEAEALFDSFADDDHLRHTMRHFAVDGARVRVTGALPKWLAEDGSADSVRHLEDELVGLRRTNDALNARLRALQA